MQSPAAALPALTAAEVPSLLELLSSALSQTPEVQKHAEGVLASLEHRQGFCSCLAVRSDRESWEGSVQGKLNSR